MFAELESVLRQRSEEAMHLVAACFRHLFLHLLCSMDLIG